MIKKVRELDRTETSGSKGSFEKKKRKQFKHQPTISKMSFNNSHNAMVLDLRGGDKSSERYVRQVAAGNKLNVSNQAHVKQHEVVNIFIPYLQEMQQLPL